MTKDEHMGDILDQALEASLDDPRITIADVLLASIAADMEYIRAQLEDLAEDRGKGDRPWES